MIFNRLIGVGRHLDDHGQNIGESRAYREESLRERSSRVSHLINASILIALIGSGCTEPDKELSEYPCLNDSEIKEQDPAEEAKIKSVRQALFADTDSLWLRPDRTIPVCWEESAYTYVIENGKVTKELESPYRELVKKAIEETWQKVLAWDKIKPSEQYHFAGWEKCGIGRSDGIRIAHRNENPHVYDLGTRMAGKLNGMVLNFRPVTYETNFTETEQQKINHKNHSDYWLYHAAVHEFGHALGMAHEQNRPDKPASCTLGPAARDGSLMLGPWDPDSIMNGCAEDFKIDISKTYVLPPADSTVVYGPSKGDTIGIRAAYYPEKFKYSCLVEYKKALEKHNNGEDVGTKSRALSSASIGDENNIDLRAQPPSDLANTQSKANDSEPRVAAPEKLEPEARSTVEDHNPTAFRDLAGHDQVPEQIESAEPGIANGTIPPNSQENGDKSPENIETQGDPESQAQGSPDEQGVSPSGTVAF